MLTQHIPDWANHDVVSVRKHVFTFAPKVTGSDATGTPILFCQRKILSLRGELRIYSDASKTRELLIIAGREALTLTPTFDVFDATTHEKVGVLQRRGIRSMFRDEWHILDPNTDQRIGEIMEVGSALLHRIFRFIPQRYALRLRGQELGSFQQRFNFFEFSYTGTLDLRPDGAKSFDRRLAIAAATMLVLIEGQQQ